MRNNRPQFNSLLTGPFKVLVLAVCSDTLWSTYIVRSSRISLWQANYQLKIPRIRFIDFISQIARVIYYSIYIHKLVSSMRITSNLPSFIAIPLLLIIVIVSVLVFSLSFAILLIPLAIMGFRFWRVVRLAQKQQNKDVINGRYTVIDQKDNEL